MPDISQDLPPHIAEAVKTIAGLHKEHHRKATPAERIVDRTTAAIGRPPFLFGLIVISVAWAIGNYLAERAGGNPPDPPPFAWMSFALAWMALVIAVLILTSQRRADRLSHLREHMNLEATLLTEQKTRKIIALLEELRRDSPQIHDRHDPEAAQMAEKADPNAVLDVIEETAEDAARSRGLKDQTR
jgi:uncharacterized membrane protein